MQPQRRLNWKPSLPNHREMKYKHIELTMAPLPAGTDLAPMDSPLKDQGNSGSCSGFSSASHDEFLELQEIRLNLPAGQDPQVYTQGKFDPVSEYFIYWGERAREGTTDQDSGATTLADACIVLCRIGVPKHSTWPNTPQNLLTKPSDAAFAEAANHKATTYYALEQTAYELKRCLANGFPFLFGVTVYDSFMSEDAARTGIIPMPGDNESVEGGHALLCVGYDDATQLFKFKNSWGDSWGDKGYGYLPYAYMLNEDMSDDHFTLRRVPTTTP